jgi:ABC-type glycerol-3-phosphate transport system substrate-binding protein
VTKQRIVLWSALGLAVAIVAAGCGNAQKSSSAETEGSKAACKAAATTKPTGLPAAFPVPGELTFTEVRKDGPTIVVDGYWTSGIDEAYKEFKD